MKKILVAPSILSADFNKLEVEILNIEKAGADWLHFDVMDGHFVPNISFGIPVLKSIAKSHNLVNDVHIMISDPLTYAEQFVKAGADIVTFHLEADFVNTHRIIESIRRAGAKVGISIKPRTTVDEVLPFLKDIDLVLIMSVEPGFGGQSFIENSLDKIRILRKYIDEQNLQVLIEVDGGINQETARLVKDSGVDVLVAGSYLFGQEDVQARIEELKE